MSEREGEREGEKKKERTSGGRGPCNGQKQKAMGCVMATSSDCKMHAFLLGEATSKQQESFQMNRMIGSHVFCSMANWPAELHPLRFHPWSKG